MSAVDDLKTDALKAAGSYYAKPVIVLVVFLCLLFLADVHGRNSVITEQQTAAAKRDKKVADSVRASLAPQLARADTQLIHDTVKVRAAIAPLLPGAPVHDTVLQHLTDTLLVKTFIEKADTALHACQDLMGSCEAFRSIARATFAADSASIHSRDVLLAIKPPRSHLGIGVSLGYACNRTGCNPGLGVGLVWRF